MVCDASPTGCGAAIYFLNAAISIDLQSLAAATPWAWMARRWTTYDENVAQGWIGDPGSQARWEAYAAISAVMLWSKAIFAARGTLTIVGDALGVLFGTSALHSKDVHINRLLMELALVLAPTGRTLEAIHVWSEDNGLADQLSRMKPNDQIPAELRDVSRTTWLETILWRIVG